MRRKRRKLQLFYNIVNKNTPNYLCTLIPPTMQSTSVYPLRNWNDIILPFCRPSSTRDSFIPSTIKMWNSLNNTIRNVDTLSKFKSELKKIDEAENHVVPKHYFYVIMSLLRHSILRQSLLRHSILRQSLLRQLLLRQSLLRFLILRQ